MTPERRSAATSRAKLQAALGGSRSGGLPVAPTYLHLYLAQQVHRHALQGYLQPIGDRREVALDPDAEIRRSYRPGNPSE